MHVTFCYKMFSKDDYPAIQDGGCCLVYNRVITIFSMIDVITMLPCAWASPTELTLT